MDTKTISSFSVRQEKDTSKTDFFSIIVSEYQQLSSSIVVHPPHKQTNNVLFSLVIKENLIYFSCMTTFYRWRLC